MKLTTEKKRKRIIFFFQQISYNKQINIYRKIRNEGILTKSKRPITIDYREHTYRQNSIEKKIIENSYDNEKIIIITIK